jgi:hypothetical protein
MFDGGNILSTNLSDGIEYTMSNIVSGDAYFGSGSRYFTKKYTGLWVFAADVNAIDFF